MNCEAYSFFVGVSSDHRIVTAKIRLSLHKNTTRTTTTIHYEWALLNYKDIRDKYVIALRNKFDAQQEKTETCTPNDEYENFVYAHLKAAAKYIPTKHRTKSRVPGETLLVREKRADVKNASECNRKNPTNANALKLKHAQNELTSIYLKEQIEYIQNQIDKIRNSEEDKQSQGDTLSPYLNIICLDYVLRTSIDKIKENGFKLTKKRSRRCPAKTITDADYADDIANLANAPAQAETLLYSVERAATSIGLHVNTHKTEYMCFN